MHIEILSAGCCNVCGKSVIYSVVLYNENKQKNANALCNVHTENIAFLLKKQIDIIGKKA